MRSHGPAALSLLFLAAAGACDAPDDVLFDPPRVEPEEVQPGLYRLTVNQGPDLVRGFATDGVRLVYRSRGLAGFGEEWRILSIPLEGGEVREEAGLYRAGLLSPSEMGQLLLQGSRRVLVTWRATIPGLPGCPSPCPAAPAVWGLNVLRLDSADGAPLSRLPQRVVVLPNVEGAFGNAPILRRNPAAIELEERGADPYGPAIRASDSVGVLSDGETLWRFPLGNPDVPADSLGPGAFPALSQDGTRLAAAVPIGLVTSSSFCTVARGLGSCTQEIRTETPTGWLVLVYDLETGSVDTLIEGTEPLFDPLDPDRVLVRRFDGLHWVSVGTGESSFVEGTSGAASIALGPDGSSIAFSLSLFGNLDVFFVRR